MDDTLAADKMAATVTGTGNALDFLIYDESTVLTAWVAAATEAQKTAVGSYSDGYAIMMSGTAASSGLNVDTKVTGGCISGTKDTVSFGSCAVMTVAVSTATPPVTSTTWASSTTALAKTTDGTAYAATGSEWTAATVTDNAYLGFSKTWKCTNDDPSASGATTSAWTCHRFQVTEAASAAGDLRIDPTTTAGQLAYVALDKSLEYTAQATFKSAAALTLSAAAAVVAAAAF